MNNEQRAAEYKSQIVATIKGFSEQECQDDSKQSEYVDVVMSIFLDALSAATGKKDREIAVLKGSAKGLRDLAEKWHRKNDAQSTRIKELEDQIAEYGDFNRKILEEKCPTDEDHCGCVPILMRRVEKLNDALKPFAEIFNRWSQPNTSSMLEIVKNQGKGEYLEYFRTAAKVYEEG